MPKKTLTPILWTALVGCAAAGQSRAQQPDDDAFVSAGRGAPLAASLPSVPTNPAQLAGFERKAA